MGRRIRACCARYRPAGTAERKVSGRGIGSRSGASESTAGQAMVAGGQRPPAATVSVVLPTFNRLRFLRPTIESVYAQTFTDWELIIADDGSDLETREYLQSLANHSRVTVVSLPHTGRPSMVRNAALLRAAGEYVAFLDSDDLWAPRKLERQIETLRARLFKIGARIRRTTRCIRVHLATGWPWQSLFRKVALALDTG